MGLVVSNIAASCVTILSLSFFCGTTTPATPQAATTQTLPNAVTNLTVADSASSTAIIVSWTLPTTGPTPNQVLVSAFQGTTLIGQVTCTAPICSSVSIPGLAPEDSYTFKVKDGNASGFSPVATSFSITPSWSCSTANVCLTVNGESPGRQETHPASGLLHGAAAKTPAALTSPLNIKYWRTTTMPPCTPGACGGNLAYSNIERLDPTAQVTSMISQDWLTYTGESYRECPDLAVCEGLDEPTPYGGSETPWSAWSVYDQYIQSTVQEIISSGNVVSYWDLVNEPPPIGTNDTTFDGADQSTMTAADQLQWFLHTYDDVKAVDPSAQVVCPSLEQYDDYPGEVGTGNELLDFSTFLAFAAANNMDCAAFSWHEINVTPTKTDFNFEPQTLQDHVARFRALLANYPQFASSQIFINEYAPNGENAGSQPYEEMPGWIIGYMAAIEAAGVAEANHSCSSSTGCSNSLDDLLVSTSAGFETSATYWPYLYYAQMSGSTIPVTSSEQQISGLATLNSTTNTLMVLLGRHDIQETDALPASESVSMTIDVPWNVSTITVVGQAMKNGGGQVNSQPTTTTTVSVVHGVATVSIPAFSSEWGYDFTVTPN